MFTKRLLYPIATLAMLCTLTLFTPVPFAQAGTLDLTTLSTTILTTAAPADQTSPPVKTSWGQLKIIYRDDTTQPNQAPTAIQKPGVGTAILSGGVYVAWPFNYLNPKTAWRGYEGDYSGGGWIYNTCGQSQIWSHSLSDKYARDLSRLVGSSAGVPIYASRTGIVIFSGWSGGYGNTVVIWVPGENIQIRYAHLQEIGAWGGYIAQGWYVGRVGNTPGGFAPHLHMVVYHNIPLNSLGSPSFVGNMCRGDQYACPFYFW